MKLLLLCISQLLCILVKALYKLMGFTKDLFSFKIILCVIYSNLIAFFFIKVFLTD